MDIYEITGLCDVRFINKEDFVKINISRIVQNHMAQILWVEGHDGAIYNWSNIVVIRKSRV